MNIDRKAYPTDLTDTQWALLEPLVNSPNKTRGRPSQNLREVINGILYITKCGLEWRMMPHDLPAWQTVYGYYRRWHNEGIWEQINLHLSRQIQTQRSGTSSPIVLAWIQNRLKQV